MIFLVRPLTGELEQDAALPAYADATYALYPTECALLVPQRSSMLFTGSVPNPVLSGYAKALRVKHIVPRFPVRLRPKAQRRVILAETAIKTTWADPG